MHRMCAVVGWTALRSATHAVNGNHSKYSTAVLNSIADLALGRQGSRVLERCVRSITMSTNPCSIITAHKVYPQTMRLQGQVIP